MKTNSSEPDRLAASQQREWYISALWPLAVLLAFLPLKSIFDFSENPFNSKPNTIDYLVFWYAGLEAAAGRAVELYDGVKFKTGLVENFGETFKIATWLYPPHILFIYAGLSKLTYALGWLVFGIISTAVFLFTIAKTFPQNPRLTLLAAASPATFICLMQGQTGILASALLIAGLLALPTRPVLAGILIGLLTIKPQFGVLIPFILIFERRFITFAVAGATTIILIALSVLWLGTDVWLQYLTGTLNGSSAALLKYIASQEVGSMLTIYGFISALGASHEIAMIAQGLMALTCLIATYFVARSNSDRSTKIASYILLSYLVSPYVMSYDFPAAAFAAALVMSGAIEKAGKSSFTMPQRALAYAVFFLPFIQLATEYMGLPLAVVLLAAFASLMVMRCIRPSKTATSSKAAFPVRTKLY